MPLHKIRYGISKRLYDRFKDGALDWQNARVHFGLILSSSIVVNNIRFLNQLHQLDNSSIGGDSDANLYAMMVEHNADWISVKSICDWADGNKDDTHQQQAATNAARFTFHVIQQGGLLDK